jgi:transposase
MTLRTIGLDVHKRFAEVAVIEPGTGLRRAPRISTTPSALRTFARTLGADDQVVLEATANTWAIADLLAEHAGRVVVSNPMRTRAIADAKCKTDQVDAAILVRNLIDAPFTDTFGRAGERWLRELDLPVDERAQVDCALRLLETLAVEITRADRALIDVALADANVRRLLTIPGIGPVSALAIVAVVGDIQRFSRPNQLVGYLGLDPRVHQSGERPAYTGHISRQGQAHARGLLIEAALGAVRVPGPLRAFFQRLSARRGKQVAIVALARKLVVLSWHLLSKHEDYRWQSATLTETKIRRAELAAGYPRKEGWSRRPAGGPSRLQRRELERQVLQQAEAAYRAQIAAWRQTKDAAAANGARLKRADQGQMRGGGSSPILRSSHGVDRVRAEDSP